MAEVSAASMLLNAGMIAAAAASAARYRRMDGGACVRDAQPETNLDTARYMNNLRAPAPSIRAGRRLPPGGANVHVHYQAACPYGNPYGSPYGPLASGAQNLASRGQVYGQPPNHGFMQSPHYPGCAGSLCGCSQCYWRDFLTHDIEKYKQTREQLSETYKWNLHELVRRHRASPKKSRAEKDSELEKLYWYYVGRVREVYDNHCQHHRLLFNEACLVWEMPEKIVLPEDEPESIQSPRELLVPHSRQSSASLIPPSTRIPTPLPLASHGSGSHWSMDTTRINKGKGKEALDTGDAAVSYCGVDEDQGQEREEESVLEMSIADLRIDDKGKENEGKKKDVKSLHSRSSSGTTSDSKGKKISFQQRFKQLWSNKLRDRSSDKAESIPAQADEKHEGEA